MYIFRRGSGDIRHIFNIFRFPMRRKMSNSHWTCQHLEVTFYRPKCMKGIRTQFSFDKIQSWNLKCNVNSYWPCGPVYPYPFPILGVSEVFFIFILFRTVIPVSKQCTPWSAYNLGLHCLHWTHVWSGLRRFVIIEPLHEQTCLRGLRPSKTQTSLCSHRD